MVQLIIPNEKTFDKKHYLELLEGEATSSTDLGMVPYSGTFDLWPQGSSNRTRGNASGLGLASLSPEEKRDLGEQVHL